jgi:hypothetical protein
MTRYFLHLRDGTDLALDEEGADYRDLAALRATMLASARDIISGDVKTAGKIDLRLRIDAEDHAGAVVDSLPFAEAVSVVEG